METTERRCLFPASTRGRGSIDGMAWRSGWSSCAACLLLCCARKEAPAPPVPAEERPAPSSPAPKEQGYLWTSRSSDGAARLEQVRTEAACTSRCISGGGEVWSSAECLTDRDQKVFLTNDCEVAISVVESPSIDRPWAETVVLTRWRRGKREREWSGGPMLASSLVEKSNGRYRWLKAEPRYMRGGAGVELTVLTGMATRLPFRDSTALGEERYENAGSPEEPRARPYELRPALRGVAVPDSAPPPARPTPPVEPPAAPRHYTQRICFAGGGCTDVPVQAPPTIKKDSSGALTCRSEGEGCGTNADCCGGNCSGGTCR